MLELATLGGVVLTRGGSVVAWTLRGWQRQALLALLAARGQRGIDRSALASLLWPDSSEPAGRHSLDELLSRTRRELGERSLFVGSTTLALNSSVITTDVDQFAAAVAANRFSAAVDLYRGPFAQDLRTGECAALEQRIAASRAHFAREYRRVLESLASEAERRGDLASAIRWWDRIVTAEPEGSGAVLRLSSLLLTAGDAGRAIRVVRGFIRWSEEQSVAVDPAFTELLERALQSGRRTVDVVRDTGPQPSGGRQHLLGRVLGSDFRIGRLLEERTLEAAYDGTSASSGAPVEIRLVQPRVAAGVDASVFIDVMQRVMAISHRAVLPTLAVRATADALVRVTARRPAETLKGATRAGAVPVEFAARIGLQLADALADAHERGIAHGLLRPRLVCLERDEPMICSLGVGQALLGRPSSDDRTSHVSLGAPGYQSPEQLMGLVTIDDASDVYALGVILFELLSGRPCFPARGADMRARFHEAPPSIRAGRPGLPVPLDRLVQQCLAPHAADRPRSMREIARALAPHT